MGALLLLAPVPSAQICLGWCQSGSVLEDKCPAQLGVLHAGRCFPERLMLQVGWSWHPEVCIHRSAAGVWLLFLLQEHLWALWGCTGSCYCSTAAPCSARVCHRTPVCHHTPAVPVTGNLPRQCHSQELPFCHLFLMFPFITCSHCSCSFFSQTCNLSSWLQPPCPDPLLGVLGGLEQDGVLCPTDTTCCGAPTSPPRQPLSISICVSGQRPGSFRAHLLRAVP